MRIPKGVTTAEVVRMLTPQQNRRIRQLVESREREAKLEARYAAEKAQASQGTGRAVTVALAEGVPAAVLAAEIGVTTARIYQMRDAAKTS